MARTVEERNAYQRAYQRKYYLAHKEKARAYAQKYKDRHKSTQTKRWLSFPKWRNVPKQTLSAGDLQKLAPDKFGQVIGKILNGDLGLAATK